ncbi:MAG: hypothetical protein KAJ03_09685 [Gammaproteobacteria bacterium]|nr:hypothetical protein [Gammaproteobacteria bacterium]
MDGKLLEIIMPNSDVGIWLIGIVILLLLWQPLVVISLLGAYAIAYVFYMAVLFWIPMLFLKIKG